MQPDWYVKKGDTAEVVVFDLSDGSGTVDLTGTVVRFQMRFETSKKPKVDALAIIDPDQTNKRGRVRYYWTDDDVNKSGRFAAEFKVIFPGGKVATFPNGDDYILIEIGEGVDDQP